MLWTRHWSAMSLVRLASGLLIAFGASNLVPALVMVLIGTSRLDPSEIRDPAGVAKSLLVMSRDSHPAIGQLSLQLTREERQTLSRAIDGTNAPPGEVLGSALTNLLNRALDDAGLRSPPILLATNSSERARFLAARAATPLELMQANRQVIQDAFPTQIVGPRHRIEVSSGAAFFIPFSLATVCLQFGFFWVLRQFLRDERMGWNELLQGGCARPRQAIPFGICAGLCCLVLMWPVSALSSWFWKQMHHASHLQQPLLVLQQAEHPLQLAFFSVVALAAAPFFEEVFFRGLLYSSLRQRGWGWGAGVLSAVLFGAIHFDVEKFMPLAFLGWILVFVYESTGTLLAPILAHATFNAANLILFLWLPKFVEGASR
ncbi:MAG: CPBP family intramembrane metalloprotease [Verrucomicrobia bacterium]|nr:CPBP family intramembrane metalloprotease [Verrucomicrobiota bacterium]